MRPARQLVMGSVVSLLMFMLIAKGIFYPERIPVSFLGKHYMYERHVPLIYQDSGAQNEITSYLHNNIKMQQSYRTILNKTQSKPLSFVFVTLSCQARVRSKSAPFVWTNKFPDWYNITKLPVNNSRISFGRSHIDNEHISGLLHNHRSSYRQLGKLIQENYPYPFMKLEETGDVPQGRIATFNDVVVSTVGHVLHKRRCVAVINGGCKYQTDWSVPKTPIPVYDRVISIAAFWGHGIWHFLFETFVGLAHASRRDIEMSYIHVSEKNNWVKSWLKIAGISDKMIITGTIVAETLILPEMGRCGRPSFQHVQWLRSIIPSKIPKNPHSIVMIKRTKKRAMNDRKLQQLVENYARQNNLKFILHADNALPSIPEQLKRFANASIVIGPHGAGLVNLIASKPGTCVIEFLPPDPNICYMRLSALLGHNYFAVPLYNNKIVNSSKVLKTLHLCSTNKKK